MTGIGNFYCISKVAKFSDQNHTKTTLSDYFHKCANCFFWIPSENIFFLLKYQNWHFIRIAVSAPFVRNMGICLAVNFMLLITMELSQSSVEGIIPPSYSNWPINLTLFISSRKNQWNAKNEAKTSKKMNSGWDPIQLIEICKLYKKIENVI